MRAPFEAVIGLEVHVQLSTERKLFCGDLTAFGAPPNSQVCPVCLGLPGALPVLNREAVALAVRAALALECTVHETSVFARKNYFYPDLPKGYQISQFERPLATDGRLEPDPPGGSGPVRIRRIHMEEDAGKSLHDLLPGSTAVDLNRSGVPLVEIVTEPDLRSPAAVRRFLQELKRILEYLEVSDCNMEEGSLRVDANVSVRREGDPGLGTKTELKNLNSFSGVEKALRVELDRQGALVEAGRVVQHETLLWDETREQVRPMRTKEESHDYRYFPEPDLPPLRVPSEALVRERDRLPELPGARRERFVREHGLPPYDAGVLTASRPLADYFEAVAEQVEDAKIASNWVMGPLLAELGRRGLGPPEVPVAPGDLAELIGLVRGGAISDTVGKRVLRRMMEEGGRPSAIVEEEGLAQIRDRERLEGWIDQVLAEHSDEVARFRGGEKRLRGFFVGQVMQRSGGRADPREVNRLLARTLESDGG